MAGGGALPTNILIPTLALSLALVSGFTPVAVFPPFESPRRGRNDRDGNLRGGEGDVLALIFAEDMDMSEAVDQEAMEA